VNVGLPNQKASRKGYSYSEGALGRRNPRSNLGVGGQHEEDLSIYLSW